jgi:hypothetical protein
MTLIAERFEGGMRCLNALTWTCDSAADICALGESTDTVFGEAGPPDQLRRGSFQLNQEIRHNEFGQSCAFCPILICSVFFCILCDKGSKAAQQRRTPKRFARHP